MEVERTRLKVTLPSTILIMGNDGGSIPDRRDLVRSKPKAEQADRANQTRARWFFCALSKVSVGPTILANAKSQQRRLQEPIVSCPLGKLYNKDSIIEFLLDRSSYGDGDDICGHIRSLKVSHTSFCSTLVIELYRI